MAWQLTLTILPDSYVVCSLPADAPVPAWGTTGPFTSITRTRDELSILCLHGNVPDGIRTESGWRCVKLEGPFDLESTIGVLASLAVPLAAGGISIFVVSTYDTDHLLLRETRLEEAIAILTQAGHQVRHLA